MDRDQRAIELFLAPEILLAPAAQPPLTAERAFSPILRPESLAVAVLNTKGEVLDASPLFLAEGATQLIDREAVGLAMRRDRPVSRPVAVQRCGAVHPVVFTYMRAARARALNAVLPALAEATAEPRVVVLASLSAGAGPLDWACERFGLSGLQRRVVATVVHTGSIKRAATELGVAYDTAREALSGCYRRTGTRRVSELVGRLSALAFGLLPSDRDASVLLTDIWGLSQRQAAVALLVASGVSRKEAARALKLSAAVVRKELEHIFDILQVTTESELARALAGLEAQAALLAGEPGFMSTPIEPLRLRPRPDGSLTAWSDYGPADGRPVLFVHSSMTTRIAPRGLVAALQAAGFRPIAVDRPGFGMSDPLPGVKAGAHDPFEAAAQDFVALADALGVPQFDVVARGGAQFVVALARLAPALLGRAVLVNPDPPSGLDSRRVGPLGVLKEIYLRRPELIRPAIQVLARRLTRDRLRSMFEVSMRGSPADERAIADTEIFDDYHRSTRMFATGRIEGYVNEQVALAKSEAALGLCRRPDWTVLIAEGDTLHDPDIVERYWRAVLPDSDFVRAHNAGRFLAMTHTDLVVQALTARPRA